MKADWRQRLRIALTVYMRPRLLLILALGFASGLPYLLTAGTLTIRMRQECVDLGSIGVFAIIGLPYALKFLWAPLIDRIPVPGLTGLLGQRRAWMVTLHFLLIIGITLLGFSDPNPFFEAVPKPQCDGVPRNLGAIIAVGWIALGVAFLSATQDIAIDAYRVEILTEEEFGAGAAMAVYGFILGSRVLQAGTLLLVGIVDWEGAYFLTGLLLIVGIAGILLGPRVDSSDLPEGKAATSTGKNWAELFGRTYWEPLREFAKRRGWIIVLLFILFFKFGDALLSQMSGALYVDLGFDTNEIAKVVKLYGFYALLVGMFIGGVLVTYLGLGNALLFGGVLQLVSNLGYWHLAETGYDIKTLAYVVGFESFAGGVGQTAFVAFLMHLCDRRFTAGQFALFTSIMAISPKVMVIPAGFIVEATGWAEFCLFTAVAALPGIALLLWMRSIYPDVWRDRRPKEN